MSKHSIKIALMLLGSTFGATAALAHAELEHSVPAAGSTVSAAPSEVVLTFSEDIEAKFSGAEVLDAKGAHVEDSTSASGTAIHVKLKSLTPGTYKVDWHALSDDTHKTRGSFNFTIAK